MIVQYTDSTHTYDDNGLLTKLVAKGYEPHYEHGRLHRADGPADICPHYVAWYVHGERVREERGENIGRKYESTATSTQELPK